MVLVPVNPVVKKGEAGPPIANILIQKLLRNNIKENVKAQKLMMSVLVLRRVKMESAMVTRRKANTHTPKLASIYGIIKDGDCDCGMWRFRRDGE